MMSYWACNSLDLTSGFQVNFHSCIFSVHTSYMTIKGSWPKLLIIINTCATLAASREKQTQLLQQKVSDCRSQSLFLNKAAGCGTSTI
mmetsp:Transcript_22732/g.38217  ORF Transcript_22732/g.38217 Transcript_22732/m.38217 type:complete len:88 (+) Transcript_22732:1290-1553(+)